MKVAIAGLGGAATRGHLPALRKLSKTGGITVVGACDPNPVRRAQSSWMFMDIPVVADAETLVNTVNPDVLVVTADPRSHVDLIQLGLDHGCDVVCEKPVVVTQRGYSAIAKVRAERPGQVVVPVHQYRHSPVWKRIAEVVRSLSEPFLLTVQIERIGPDSHAVSDWRSDPQTGGGLADHGVHFLALAHDLSGSLVARSASRKYDHLRREHVLGTVAVGSGTLVLDVNYCAPVRRSTVTLQADGRWIQWQDNQWRVSVGEQFETVAALSDRQHVDELYLPFYQDVVANWSASHWREARWNEVVNVGHALTQLLQQADSTPVADQPAPVRGGGLPQECLDGGSRQP